jgi:hypothetical protein
VNNLRTLERTNQKAIPITGTTVKTAKANFQLIIKSKILAHIIKKTEEIIEEIACETNVFTESTSEVRFVRSFEGPTV